VIACIQRKFCVLRIVVFIHFRYSIFNVSSNTYKNMSNHTYMYTHKHAHTQTCTYTHTHTPAHAHTVQIEGVKEHTQKHSHHAHMQSKKVGKCGHKKNDQSLWVLMEPAYVIVTP